MPDSENTAIDWTEFESSRFSFDNIGDTAVGTVVSVRVESPRGDRVPVLTLKDPDGHERELWAGPWDLKTQLAAIHPAVGDGLTVTLVELRHTGNASPMKCFSVSHTTLGEEPF